MEGSRSYLYLRLSHRRGQGSNRCDIPLSLGTGTSQSRSPWNGKRCGPGPCGALRAGPCGSGHQDFARQRSARSAFSFKRNTRVKAALRAVFWEELRTGDILFIVGPAEGRDGVQAVKGNYKLSIWPCCWIQRIQHRKPLRVGDRFGVWHPRNRTIPNGPVLLRLVGAQVGLAQRL